MPMRIGVSLLIVLSAFVGLEFPQSVFGQEKDAPQQAPDKTTQEDVIRRRVDVVSVYFTVRDNKKRLVSDLPQDQFSVTEDGRPQAVKFFAHHTDVVLNVGVLLDTGTNMAWILGQEAQASAMFVKHVVRPTDLGFIVSYASRVEMVQLPTSDVALLQEMARSIQIGGAAIGLPDPGTLPSHPVSLPGGGTVGINGKPVNNKDREAHLYDAIRVSTHRYLSGEVGRKAIVVVALSGDSQSESSMEDALQAMLEEDVIAYVLQIYDAPGRDKCDVLHIFQKNTLKELAEATGGRMLEVRGIDKLESALDEISDELHHQYSLGYYPENKNWDGKFRKIQISAGEKDYKVHAREGYFANLPGAKSAATH
jgi:VWFA-related protein